MHKLDINGQEVSLDTLRQVWEGPVRVLLGDNARKDVEKSKSYLDQFLAKGGTAYGINTGFGKLATVAIEPHLLSQLQQNLVRSHSVGVGSPLPKEVVRLAIVLKIIAFARGFSGVRSQLIDALCSLVSNGVYPVVPSKGSVGASGDLAPLAHIARLLIGEGNVHFEDKIVPARIALEALNLKRIDLAPKEGLALLNGTQISTSLALAALFRTEHVLAASLVAGAMSTDAVQGSDSSFDERIQKIRGHRGQVDIGSILFELMKGSEIRASHLTCTRVQDPYSIRCQPQVTGACLDTLRHAADVLQTEANAVTDNPLVFSDTTTILSGGNFHAEPVAIVADHLALAIAEIGSLSERRIALLMDSNLSGLPAFLVQDSGLNSGFMMAQVTAASLASENKSLAHPSSTDNIPTSANQEDHVSMATFAARRLHDMVENTTYIVAIELLAAAQGLELHRPMRSSIPLENTLNQIRSLSAPYSSDRSLASEIEEIAQTIATGDFCEYSHFVLPSMNL